MSKGMVVSLRLTTPDDLDFVMQTEAAEQDSGTIGSWTRAEHQAAIESADMVHFIIERDTRTTQAGPFLDAPQAIRDQRPVGYLILQDMTNAHRNIQVRRIVVAEKGQGYGRQSLKLIKKIAFETYGAYRLWLDVKPYNSRAQSLYESEGFVVEGTLRDCVQLNESHQIYRDTGQQRTSLTLMSILRPEYEG